MVSSEQGWSGCLHIEHVLAQRLHLAAYELGFTPQSDCIKFYFSCVQLNARSALPCSFFWVDTLVVFSFWIAFAKYFCEQSCAYPDGDVTSSPVSRDWAGAAVSDILPDYCLKTNDPPCRMHGEPLPSYLLIATLQVIICENCTPGLSAAQLGTEGLLGHWKKRRRKIGNWKDHSARQWETCIAEMGGGQVCAGGGQQRLSSTVTPHCVFWDSVSHWCRFTASASLAAQWTPQILLSLPSPPCWITDMHYHVWLLCGYWETTLGYLTYRRNSGGFSLAPGCVFLTLRLNLFPCVSLFLQYGSLLFVPLAGTWPDEWFVS